MLKINLLFISALLFFKFSQKELRRFASRISIITPPRDEKYDSSNIGIAINIASSRAQQTPFYLTK